MIQFCFFVHTLSSDNAKKYFLELSELEGHLHATSCSYVHSQNDMTKRKNRHLLETTKTLFPKTFWVDVVSTSCF